MTITLYQLYQPSSDSLFGCLLPEAWGRVLFCPDGADGRRTAGYGMGRNGRPSYVFPFMRRRGLQEADLERY